MKPIDIENEVLLALRRCGGKNGRDGSTVNRLHRMLSPAASGVGPSWRDVTRATLRLQSAGLVEIVGDETIGKDCHPLYALTEPQGVQAAASAALQKRNAEAAGKPKTEHDSVREAGQ